MKAFNLLFNPKSICIVGRFLTKKSPEFKILKNLQTAEAPLFDLFLLKYHDKKVVEGQNITPLNTDFRFYHNILDINYPIDVMFLFIEDISTLNFAIDECKKKSPAVVCCYFSATSKEKQKFAHIILSSHLNQKSLIIGPNVSLLVNNNNGLYISPVSKTFAFPPGNISIIIQEHTLPDVLLFHIKDEKLPISKLIAGMDERFSNVSFADLMNYFASDIATSTIGMCATTIDNNGASFLQATAYIALQKPVIMYRPFISEITQKYLGINTRLHSSAVYHTVFSQTGIVQTSSVSSFLNTLLLFSQYYHIPPLNKNLAVIAKNKSLLLYTIESLAPYSSSLLQYASKIPPKKLKKLQKESQDILPIETPKLLSPNTDYKQVLILLRNLITAKKFGGILLVNLNINNQEFYDSLKSLQLETSTPIFIYETNKDNVIISNMPFCVFTSIPDMLQAFFNLYNKIQKIKLFKSKGFISRERIQDFLSKFNHSQKSKFLSSAFLLDMLSNFNIYHVPSLRLNKRKNINSFLRKYKPPYELSPIVNKPYIKPLPVVKIENKRFVLNVFNQLRKKYKCKSVLITKIPESRPQIQISSFLHPIFGPRLTLSCLNPGNTYVELSSRFCPIRKTDVMSMLAEKHVCDLNDMLKSYKIKLNDFYTFVANISYMLSENLTLISSCINVSLEDKKPTVVSISGKILV